MMRARATLLIVAVACADGSGDTASEAMRVQPLPTPAGARSGEPSIAVDDDGRALLTWLEATDSGAVLRIATLDDTAWSQPRTIAAGRDFIVNWADFPSAIPLGGDRIAAHWLQREGSDTYAYGVRTSFSADGGRSWSDPVRPHADSTETEHGFVSLLPAGEAVDAIWLDGRKFAAGRAEMTLRTARVGPASIRGEAVLDERVCDCCQTDAALTSAGAVVVYRDRSAGEIRDIAIVRRLDGRWTEPRIIHADGWRIDGCPVNGPAVAASGERVAVAWFTAAHDSARVLLAFSRDGGASFGEPVRLDDGDPAGRVDVAMVDGGDVVVSWIEQRGADASLRLRRVSPAGIAGDATTVASVSASRAAGFPRMAVVGESVVIAWTDVEAATVRSARVSLQ